MLLRHASTFLSCVTCVFVEIDMLRLFHIFCSDVPIACPLFNRVCNSVVHTLSSVIPYGNIHLLQLLILNEYAALYAVARHYLGLVVVDE